MLQYRDIFDNHSPLFQMLCAPLFAAFPQNPGIVIDMRLAMIPLFVISMWCVYRIATRLFSAEAGAWSVVIAAICPPLFFKSIEFRTDDMWMAAWLLMLERGLAVPLTKRVALCAGLIAGIAFSVSMKTVLLMAALASAVVLVLLIGRRPSSFAECTRWLASRGMLFGLGLVVVPLAILAYFASQHALGNLYYCIIQHNQTHGMGRPHGPWYELKFFVALPVFLGIAWLISHKSRDAALGFRRAVLFLSGMLYLGALLSFWPLVTGQDFLPVLPSLVAVIVPGFLALRDLIGKQHPWPRVAIAASLLIFAGYELKLLINEGHPSHERALNRLQWIEIPLRLTDPSDYVMDAKGETLFRRRPFYWVLETVTRIRIVQGLIHDSIPKALIETRTPVVVPYRLYGEDLKFVQENYLLGAGDIFVLGKWLPPGTSPNAPASFKITIPGIYRFVTETGGIEGQVDGVPCSGSLYIEAGDHRFQPAKEQEHVAVVWSKAFDRGFKPGTGNVPHSAEGRGEL